MGRGDVGVGGPGIEADTIAAPATAPGEAGVAIIRVSGQDALSILDKVFRAVSGKRADNFADRKLVRGTLVSAVAADGDAQPDEAPIDDCLAVVMRAPHSFTGEHVAEIHCHGGAAVVSAALDAILGAGARLAQPGEFSKRAFLNGKMDLSQAEALGDLIGARTQLSRRIALRQLRGGLSARVEAIRSKLIDASALLEAHLDFPDEDIPALRQESIVADLHWARGECLTLLSGAKRGMLVREGARVVLAGRPNAGKSSLFNALLGRERAIVTPHPGTTRDTLEATIDLRGLAVTLVDTAGLRETIDEVERLGVERTVSELRGADLVLHVRDATSADEGALDSASTKLPVIQVWNKVDLISSTSIEVKETGIAISAFSKLGLENLEDAISHTLLGNTAETEIHVVRARHADCLGAAEAAIKRAADALQGGLSGELVMVDLREALIQLGEITGERLDEQILDRVFSTFCLGK